MIFKLCLFCTESHFVLESLSLGCLFHEMGATVRADAESLGSPVSSQPPAQSTVAQGSTEVLASESSLWGPLPEGGYSAETSFHTRAGGFKALAAGGTTHDGDLTQKTA